MKPLASSVVASINPAYAELVPGRLGENQISCRDWDEVVVAMERLAWLAHSQSEPIEKGLPLPPTAAPCLKEFANLVHFDPCNRQRPVEMCIEVAGNRWVGIRVAADDDMVLTVTEIPMHGHLIGHAHQTVSAPVLVAAFLQE